MLKFVHISWKGRKKKEMPVQRKWDDTDYISAMIAVRILRNKFENHFSLFFSEKCY